MKSVAARTRTVLVSLLLAGAGGCAAYAVPGHGVNLQSMQASDRTRAAQTDPSVNEALDKKPLAQFPATVAIVRVQGADYTGRTVQLYGEGSYKVVLTHDVETPEQLAALGSMPMLAGLEPINRLELPQTLNSDQDLRSAAAMLHADMLLIYTFDDKFDDRDVASALTLLTIGIAPTKSLTVTSTASAVLLDTRNGYVYGAAEAMHKKTTLANCWGENGAADAVREQVETAAFADLVGELRTTWGKVVRQYAPPATQPKT